MPGLDDEWSEVDQITAEAKSGAKILWQCHIFDQNDRSIWVDYDETANQRIETALMAKLSTVTLPEPFEDWMIDFKDMVQSNRRNGKTRPVRRTVLVAGLMQYDGSAA